MAIQFCLRELRLHLHVTRLTEVMQDQLGHGRRRAVAPRKFHRFTDVMKSIL